MATIKHFIPAMILLLLSVVASFVASVAIIPPNKGYAVLYPPSTSLQENILKAESAGMKVMRAGAFDFLLIVQEDKGKTNGVKSLYDHGALFVFNPLVAGGCYTASISKTS